MSFTESANYAVKTIIGATGTTASIMLENVSVVVSILAGLATLYFMYQSGKHIQEKRKAFKEDRDNEHS